MAEEGAYRALPQVDDSVLGFVMGGDGPSLVGELASVMRNLGDALERVDAEMAGLESANPNLARLVRGTVEGLYAVFADQVPSEVARAFLRVVGYFNAFILLRALDMQWRKAQTP